MAENRKIRVGITHGDTNGIGYELILKVFAESTMLELCTPVVYGSPKVAIYHRKATGMETGFQTVASADEAQDGRLNIVTCVDEEVKVEFGKASEESGRAAYAALERAVEDWREGKVDVLVTAPINKSSIQNENFHFPGHTEYIQERLGDGDEALMILMNDTLRMALVTTHLPLKDISAAITREAVEHKLRIFDRSLRRDFMIGKPRIAVLSLNPHAGDNGLLGQEELEIICPAMKAVEDEGILCFGPFAADGFFGSRAYERYDGVLAMYHDQGLAPFKALAMEDGVNFTAGLPVVRTSPAHGTAYDLAGQGKADENSFRQAIYTAMDVLRNRVRYDEARTNPLRKHYHERRDDSDKLNMMEK
ncbi:MAG: 4-hydroxythreonine-4-phosphate dehydrogenase PdxA [Clostridium sp.]|nr:4-hydroxythreonine-4-phosphate dehydrogenase PdxA [Clostridium sp.]